MSITAEKIETKEYYFVATVRGTVEVDAELNEKEVEELVANSIGTDIYVLDWEATEIDSLDLIEDLT